MLVFLLQCVLPILLLELAVCVWVMVLVPWGFSLELLLFRVAFLGSLQGITFLLWLLPSSVLLLLLPSWLLSPSLLLLLLSFFFLSPPSLLCFLLLLPLSSPLLQSLPLLLLVSFWLLSAFVLLSPLWLLLSPHCHFLFLLFCCLPSLLHLLSSPPNLRFLSSPASRLLSLPLLFLSFLPVLRLCRLLSLVLLLL